MDELATYLHETNQFQVEVVTATKDKARSVIRDYSIKRVFSLSLDKNKKIGRVINGLLFFISTFFSLLFKPKKSILLIVSNPPFLPFLGYILKKIRGFRYLTLIHDQYPEIAVNLGYLKKNSTIVKIWQKINYRVFDNSYFVITLGKKMRKHLIDLYPNSNLKLNSVVITNWANKNRLYPLENKSNIKEVIGLKDKFVVQYSGNMGLFHSTEKIIEVADLLKDNSEIVFQLIGGGAKKESLQKMVSDKGLKNVIFFDYVTIDRLNFSLNSADIALITLSENSYNLAVPSKFQGIIASGIPVIGILNENNDIGYEIAKESVGYISNDPKEVANKILFLYKNRNLLNFFKDKALNLFQNKYDMPYVCEKYKKILNKIGNNKMIDLHCHSNYSDGSHSVREIILKAKESGITHLAITDHDTVDGMDEKISIAKEFGINLISGIEISCDFEGGELHILGLFFDHKNIDLNNFLTKLKKFRTERNIRLFDKFKEIGINIDMDELLGKDKKIEAIGKPNFAKYLVDKGIVKNFREAFRKYLRDGGLADVKKERVTEKEAIDEIHKASGIAILAHPDQTGINNIAQFESFIKDMKSKGLDGIEVYYTGYTKKEIKFYKKIATKHGLLITGGSDFHGENKNSNIKLGYYGEKKQIPSEIIDYLENYLQSIKN